MDQRMQHAQALLAATQQDRIRKQKELKAMEDLLKQAEGAGAYKVKKGDSLWKLAKQYGTSVQELASYNGIKDPSMIREGATLYIPSAASAPAAPNWMKPSGREFAALNAGSPQVTPELGGDLLQSLLTGASVGAGMVAPSMIGQGIRNMTMGSTMGPNPTRLANTAMRERGLGVPDVVPGPPAGPQGILMRQHPSRLANTMRPNPARASNNPGTPMDPSISRMGNLNSGSNITMDGLARMFGGM